MPADPWTDVARMAGCVAVTAVGVAPLLLVGGKVATAVRWWAVLTPAVLVLHAVVNAVFVAAGTAVEEHPLAKNTPQPALLVLQACFLAPLIEEVIFRGLILFALRAAHEALTWVALAGTIAAAAYYGGGGPALFSGLVAVAWVGARFGGFDRGVYGSAALFAAVHSAVWPTPIPLLAFGLGLGVVALRTNGVLAPAIVHGLFNTVSVLFVLSSGAK
ncbi:CPBP family intramembrane metalloprotease [bacterium]|nr:CPBP family intramembrane metalloprotease [bacterium]